MPITHVAPTPQTRDGFFYATNNPYQLNGPRGFTEFKYMPETTDLFVRICRKLQDSTPTLFVRIDFPGVIKESVTTLVDPSNKAVFVNGDAPKGHEHDSSARKYGTVTGLSCDCCEISNIQYFVGDGVVRLILSKKKLTLHAPSNPYEEPIRRANFFAQLYAFAPMLREQLREHLSADNTESSNANGHPLAHLRGLNPLGRTDPLDPAFTGPVIIPYPSVLEGPDTAYETKRLPNGGLFLRIDMPGVPRENFTVEVDEGGSVTVVGLATLVMHDSSGRYYGGKVAVVPEGYDCRLIKKITKHGVLRLIIPASP